MRNLVFQITALFGCVWLLSGCEDLVDLKTEEGPPMLVVDAWITNQPGEQTVKLTQSGAYFDNHPARPATNAEVWIEDNSGRKYVFTATHGDGIYRWAPAAADSSMGVIGGTYRLTIRYGGEEYFADNQINRVPKVDSLVFTHESWPFTPETGPKNGFIAEFFARDFEGKGDCYWIKPLRDGKPNKQIPSRISLAYDAAYSSETSTDGLILIQPLRQSITVGELFNDRDSVGVELLSINEDAFHFLSAVRTESSNGGLFAVPFSNLPTNIQSKSGKKALGFFGASAVSRFEQRVDASIARPKPER